MYTLARRSYRMTMLLKHAKAMVLYWNQLKGKQIFAKACQAQCDHICTRLASETMEFGLSAELNEVLEQAPFTDAQKQSWKRAS